MKITFCLALNSFKGKTLFYLLLLLCCETSFAYTQEELIALGKVCSQNSTRNILSFQHIGICNAVEEIIKRNPELVPPELRAGYIETAQRFQAVYDNPRRGSDLKCDYCGTEYAGESGGVEASEQKRSQLHLVHEFGADSRGQHARLRGDDVSNYSGVASLECTSNGRVFRSTVSHVPSGGKYNILVGTAHSFFNMQMVEQMKRAGHPHSEIISRAKFDLSSCSVKYYSNSGELLDSVKVISVLNRWDNALNFLDTSNDLAILSIERYPRTPTGAQELKVITRQGIRDILTRSEPINVFVVGYHNDLAGQVNVVLKTTGRLEPLSETSVKREEEESAILGRPLNNLRFVRAISASGNHGTSGAPIIDSATKSVIGIFMGGSSLNYCTRDQHGSYNYSANACYNRAMLFDNIFIDDLLKILKE